MWIFINTEIIYYIVPDEDTLDGISISHVDIPSLNKIGISHIDTPSLNEISISHAHTPSLNEIIVSHVDTSLVSEQPTLIDTLTENNWKFPLEYLNFCNLLTIISVLLIFIRQSASPSEKILYLHFIIFLDTTFTNYSIESNPWEINLSKILFSCFMIVFAFVYFLTKHGANIRNNEKQIITCFIFNIAWLSITISSNFYHFLSAELYEWFVPATMKIIEEVVMNFISLPFIVFFWYCAQCILETLELNSYITMPRAFRPREILNIAMGDISRIFGLIFIGFIMFSIYWILEIIYFCPKILSEGFIMISCGVLSYFLLDKNINSRQLDNNLAAVYLEICVIRGISSWMF